MSGAGPAMARWSTDRPCRRERGQAWAAVVPLCALLADVSHTRTGSSEWVVDPRGLADVSEWDGAR